MAAAKIDIVLQTVAKERSTEVKEDAIRWNPTQKTFEYWNGTTWVDVLGTLKTKITALESK